MEDYYGFYTVRGYELLEHDKKLLTPSMEDYLEMIYRNSINENSVKINSLSKLLNVKAPSATRMVQKLKESGLLKYEKYGEIQLTEKGKEIGRFLLERHNVIEKFLINIGVKDNILIETELIEHVISIKTLEIFNLFNLFLAENPCFKKLYIDFISSHRF
ncbi:MAG: metal-dependent transcriptional regulator [Thermoanaerobacteraceae bacterium]